MYTSVKKYSGFYVGRYEMGIDTQRTANTTMIKGLDSVHLKMNKIPYTCIGWSSSNTINVDTGGAVEVARSLYPKTDANYGVVSTLIYGVQWDTIANWYISSKAVASITDSIGYGNYLNQEITLADINIGSKYAIDNNYVLGSYTNITELTSKDTTTSWALTTGALKKAKVNNIYDMAGNMMEWTMEGGFDNYRIGRGSDFASTDYQAVKRSISNSKDTRSTWSFRSTLYIK